MQMRRLTSQLGGNWEQFDLAYDSQHWPVYKAPDGLEKLNKSMKTMTSHCACCTLVDLKRKKDWKFNLKKKDDESSDIEKR
jgi:hypothetical protein